MTDSVSFKVIRFENGGGSAPNNLLLIAVALVAVPIISYGVYRASKK